MLSCSQLTAPVDVPVVDPAKRPQAAEPKRVSLPSKFPPGCCEVACWVTPTSLSFGLPAVSKPMAIPAAAIQRTNIAANTAHPWRLSFTSFPNVYVERERDHEQEDLERGA